MNELSHTPQSSPLSPEAQDHLATSTIGQIVDQIAVLLQNEDTLERKQYEALYASFYRKKGQIEQSKSADMEQILLQEARLNDLNQQYKAIERKRSEALAALQLENGTKAEDLLNKLEQLLGSDEDFKVIYERFHQLREEWEHLRPLTQQDESRLGKRFISLRDSFYELKNVDAELRDNDYSKHLEQKRQILEELRLLSESADIIASLARLNNEIVPRWRDVGPVAPELRSEINGSYKELSTAIFKKHQTYQEDLKAGEAVCAHKKAELIDKIALYLTDKKPQNITEWNSATEVVKALQEEWKSLGNAGRKHNNELYLRYRVVCQDFFTLKSEYFKQRKQEQSEGIAQRKALIERAVATAASDKYNETIIALTALQEEWKSLPALRRSVSDSLWQEFRKPFEDFYKRKREHDRRQHHIEHRNEEQKRALIAKLQGYAEASELPERLKDKLLAIKEDWRKLGRANAKVNDELWAEFCRLNDELYGRLRSLQGERRQERSRSHQSTQGEPAKNPKDELQHLQRKAERMRAELRNYENNLNFLSSTSKGNNPLMREVERKHQQLVQSIARIEEQIVALSVE